jgi:RNA polymerase sigma factor (sigma-70 family)
MATNRSNLLLTRDNELRLAAEIAAGSDEAVFELANAVEPVIAAVAAKFRIYKRLEREDLLSEGRIAALNAARSFSGTAPRTQGAPANAAVFPSYSRFKIRAAMLAYAREFAYAVVVPENAFKKKTGRESSHSLAKGWSHLPSLDQPMTDGTRLGDNIASDDDASDYEKFDMKHDVWAAVAKVSPVHARWAQLTADGMTPTEMAQELGVSTARVSQIKAAALAALSEILSAYAF